MAKFQLKEIVNYKTNEILQNRTRKYLLPILKEYGEIFKKKFNMIFKVSCGIGDSIVKERGVNCENHIFILINTKISPKSFIDFITWIKQQSYYERDYIYGNLQNSNFHMVVLKIPEKFQKSLENFKKSKYSKMYSTEELNLHFHNYIEEKKVLSKDTLYKEEFIKKINKEFETNIKDFDIEDYELDFPIDILEEIF